MDFEQALVYELQTILVLVDKVFPTFAEENIKPPMVVYISSEGEKVMTLSGPTNLTELTCEIHLITESYAELKDLSKQVINKIRDFFQRVIGIDGPYIKSVSLTEPVEEKDNNTNYHQCSFDMRVRF
jgi:hypothetical protein